MAEKIPMTALSPTMEEGTISAWQKKAGDTVAAGDVLCEVETDKASMEYESTQEGTLLKILVDAGNMARVGQTIAIIGEKGEDIAALEKEIASEGSEGGAVGEDESQAQGPAPTKPATTRPDEPSKADGKTDTSGDRSAGTISSGAGPAETPPTVAATQSGGSRIKASPLAVKLAAERNISLSLVKGTGPGGRIVQRDIEEFRGVPGGVAAGSPQVSYTGTAPAQRDEVIPVSGKRAVIARRLSESKFSAPHYYLKTSVVMDDLAAARKSLNSSSGLKVSLNAYFMKLTAEALKRHPDVNASWQGDSITRFGSIDIGLAVDVGNGLITPVVRDCGNRGVLSIDGELQELIQKARDGKLKPEEYTGATFTISNLGSFGVEEFTAIINPPGSAILALGAARKTPVVQDDGSIGVATVMKMTLSCDHRVIDGAEGGRFLHDLQLFMEQPVRVMY